MMFKFNLRTINPFLCSHHQRHYGTRKKVVRIGCGSGFWGDTPTAPGQLIKRGNLDFLVLDYLSEVTMSLLVAAKQKSPEIGGWCPDFVQSVGPFLPLVKEQGIKIITNAGGVNPRACMKTLLQTGEQMGLKQGDLKIALITGDDCINRDFDNVKVKKGPNFKVDKDKVTSANAYLGAGPISKALDLGADIVVTGRCTDSALALGPLIHKYGWSPSDFDLMAKGSLAGHLIECGAQSTGGIFTDWDSVSGWENNGFPIAIVEENGDLTITKPEGTGGLVNKGTVAEQLLYEIGDPRAYLLPDVICDFSQVQVQDVGDGSVRVTGAKGRPPTEFYKVGGTFQDGWKSTAVCPIIGPRSVEKGRKTAEAILRRSRGLFSFFKLSDFTRTHIQILGSEEAYGEQARDSNLRTRDAVLWLSVHHQEKKALELFSREIASAGTGMAPGLTAVIGGRPKPMPLLKFFSYLIPRDEVQVTIELSDGHKEIWKDTNYKFTLTEALKPEDQESSGSNVTKGQCSYKLSDLAWLRSGDKGDSCNIGVIARDPEFYPYIKSQLGTREVQEWFKHKFSSDGSCKRYHVPGIHGLNFVLEGSLGGGGIAALNPDPQGKGYAQMLADFEIKNVPKLN